MLKFRLLGLQLSQKEAPTQLFFCEYCEIFKNAFFEEHLQKTASFCFTSKYYNVAKFGLDETSIKCSYIIYM